MEPEVSVPVVNVIWSLAYIQKRGDYIGCSFHCWGPRIAILSERATIRPHVEYDVRFIKPISPSTLIAETEWQKHDTSYSRASIVAVFSDKNESFLGFQQSRTSAR